MKTGYPYEADYVLIKRTTTTPDGANWWWPPRTCPTELISPEETKVIVRQAISRPMSEMVEQATRLQ